MKTLLLQPTTTAQWHSLVQEAESASHLRLPEDLESYLIFLLHRFTSRPEIAGSVLALEYLQSMQEKNIASQNLQEIGDKCLLFAGLFPGRALRRRVHISYFVKLGQGAYNSLAARGREKFADLYTNLSKGFVSLMDVLQVMREFDNQVLSLTPLQAQELWQDVASAHAHAVLQRYAVGIPLFGSQDKFKINH